MILPLFLAAAALFILFAYFGYPAVLWILCRIRPAPVVFSGDLPEVTVLVAAFNEEAFLGDTLRSILRSDYPPDRLRALVVSDASTDRTDEIAASFPPSRVSLLRMRRRSGKPAALDAGAKSAGGDILLLADASGLFHPDAVRLLVRHFGDPRVGACVGRKRIVASASAVSSGDGAYWRYESALRHMESRLGSSWIGCEGGMTAVRRGLFAVDFPHELAEDTALCYRLYERGFLNSYDPEAIVMEIASKDMGSEFSRKVRVIVRGMKAMWAFRRFLRPFRHPMFFFQNTCHRLFRWAVPFPLLFLWAGSGFLPGHAGTALFSLQTCFYALAYFDARFRRNKPSGLLSIPSYFSTVNLAALVAWFSLFRKYSVWERAEREAPAVAVPGVRA